MATTHLDEQTPNMADVANENTGEVSTPTSLDTIAKSIQDLTHQVKRLSSLPDQLHTIEKKIERDNQDICQSLKLTEEQTKEAVTIATNTDIAVAKLRDELAVERHNAKRLQHKLEEAQRKILHLESYSRKQNLIIEGLPEKQGENTEELVMKLITENMGLTLTGAPIDKCHRFGRTGNMRPRPIIIRFVKISTRDIILQNAKKLRNGNPNTQVYINEDLPPQVKKERAALRAIATHARHLEPQVSAKVAGDTLHINGESYRYEDIELLPVRFSLAAARTPQVSPNVVGFASEYFPLSNFYKCDIQIEGETWDSTEQYFQHKKCQVTQNDRAANLIRKETDPFRIKNLGDKITIKSTSEWPRVEERVMRDALQAKFSQHPELLQVLLNTEDSTLVEATHNWKWGGACGLWSVELKTLCYKGQNKLGKLLMEIRGQMRP